MLRSGLVVEVPVAEDLVAPWRRQLDPQAVVGVPAHITVLFPFAPATLIDSAMLAAVATAVEGVRPFDFTLSGVRWFGDAVVWLAPEPSAGFLELTSALTRAFPAYPPYGGAHDEVVPHLTVGDAGSLAERIAAGAAIAGGLPLQARAEAVTLLTEGDDGRWHRRERFGLKENS